MAQAGRFANGPIDADGATKAAHFIQACSQSNTQLRRFISAWPNNRISVVGGAQAAGVMRIVTEEGARRAKKPVDTAALDNMEAGIISQFDRESTALYATAHLWDDGLIDPRDSRKVLAYCLSICREAEMRPLKGITFGVGRM